MRIVVCVKQVPETDNVKIDERTGTLKRNSVSGILNPADVIMLLKAMELAEAIKEREEKVIVTALTMGPLSALEVLREGMAYGADEGVLLCDKCFAGADTWATSLVLAAAVRRLGDAVLVLTGEKSTDGETGHIGPQLAKHLDWPQLTGADELQYDKGVEIHRDFDNRRETLRVKLPAVISVAAGSEAGREGTARYLSIGEIEEAFEKNLTVWKAEDIGVLPEHAGLCGSRTEVRRVMLPEPAKKGIVLTGSLSEIAKTLVERLV